MNLAQTIKTEYSHKATKAQRVYEIEKRPNASQLFHVRAIHHITPCSQLYLALLRGFEA